MRRIVFFFSLFLMLPCMGQDNILISSKHVSRNVEKSNEILRKNPIYTSVDFVDINMEKILEHEEFLLQLGERNISIRKERIAPRGINNYIFVGSNDAGCRILISVFNNDIQGVIETEEDVFTIATVGKNNTHL